MDFVKFSIQNPVTVLVGVILILLFGLVSFKSLPYQLSPNVNSPVISVTTIWPGATPYEIERDIVEEQEKVLKGLARLDTMESTSSNNRGQITLTFDAGSDIDESLLRVSNKLDQVSSYPENVDRPIVTASGAESSPVVYLGLRTVEGNERDIDTYLTFFENEVRQYLERVDGVGDVRINGGVEREMHVILDSQKLAAYGLTVGKVVSALRNDNINLSAGTMDVGRREYRIRAISEFRTPDDIANMVVVSDGQRRILLSDLARVEFGYDEQSVPSLQDGVPGLVVFIVPEPDANVLAVTDDIEDAIEWLNAEKLEKAGLRFYWLGDQRPYINGAIRLLQQNILIGGCMAMVVLLLFLRSFASTLIVATAIPISIIGAFIFMRIFGTTLNAISLAGIAFAVGMLVDNAIVVLENIDRHRRMGKNPKDAAYDGTREVWGAVLASSLTTVAVFLPIIFLELEAGLLFRDIAVAVTSAVLISLVVSVSVIPMVARKLFENRFIHRIESRSTGSSVLSAGGRGLANVFMAVVGLALRNFMTRSATIVALSGAAVFVAVALVPKMEYLPQGSRDLIFNMLMPPPGLSYAERLEIGHQVSDFLKDHFEPGENDPGIEQFFFMGRQEMMMVGVISKDQMRTRELLPICREMIARIPGVFGVSNQASIFGRGIGRGRTIDVDVSGADIDELVSVAGRLMEIIRQDIPDAQIRPVPSLDVLYPEAHFTPDGESLRAVGMTPLDFAIALDVLMDGRNIGDFKQEGEKKIDLVVKLADNRVRTPEDLLDALIPTPAGKVVPISSLATLEKTTGLASLRHLERNRTVTLQVTPPYSITIQEAMETIVGEIIPKLGLGDDINIAMSGTADKLVETRRAMQVNFILAAAIIYLLMSALFGNFFYPLIIMFTVPLAGAGGFIGLRLVNIFVAPQQMDVLTMLGFVILIGVVVNNAILIVHQALNNIRHGGMDHFEAVVEATRTRLRPIYMTAATSIFGMLPLVVMNGPGAELYRGLGSVVLGGLAISTIFTVFLIPSLLLFFIRMEKPVGQDPASDLLPAK